MWLFVLGSPRITLSYWLLNVADIIEIVKILNTKYLKQFFLCSRTASLAEVALNRTYRKGGLHVQSSSSSLSSNKIKDL